MSPKDREWYLLNAADIRSGGDAPAGSTAGCQLMGLDVWVRLRDCPDFDDVWGQSERPCVQETSGECHRCMALLVRGHSSVGHHCRVKHHWFMACFFISRGHNFCTWVMLFPPPPPPVASPPSPLPPPPSFKRCILTEINIFNQLWFNAQVFYFDWCFVELFLTCGYSRYINPVGFSII